MGKVEKPSPSPTYLKSESKRSKTTVKAIGRTDENAMRQHARQNTAMAMDETIETDREASETDEEGPKNQYARTNDINHEFLWTEGPA